MRGYGQKTGGIIASKGHSVEINTQGLANSLYSCP